MYLFSFNRLYPLWSAWKIVQVLRGWAHPSILKTVGALIVSKASAHPILVQYESERKKYAQDLIDFDKKFAAFFSGKPKTSENEDGVSHEQFLKYANLLHIPALDI